MDHAHSSEDHCRRSHKIRVTKTGHIITRAQHVKHPPSEQKTIYMMKLKKNYELYVIDRLHSLIDTYATLYVKKEPV